MHPTAPLPSALLRLPYLRPNRLSDPYHDFSSSHLKALLQAPDAELKFYHFTQLFGPYLPAGTDEEVVYFLPLALDYLLTQDEDAVEVITPIVGFVSKNGARLRENDLWNEVVDALRRSLIHWTSSFRVVHFDREACRAKGWGLPYFDLVERSETVVHMTVELVRFDSLSDLAVEFIRDLANVKGGRDEEVRHAMPTSADTQAAWFLEYSRSREDVTGPPDFPPIMALITDKERLHRAAQRVRGAQTEAEASPTYWSDTFRRLAM